MPRSPSMLTLVDNSSTGTAYFLYVYSMHTLPARRLNIKFSILLGMNVIDLMGVLAWEIPGLSPMVVYIVRTPLDQSLFTEQSRSPPSSSRASS